MNTALWIVQWMLAVLFLAHGVLYLVPPQAMRKTMERMPFSLGFLRFVGVAEVLAASGLVLPGLTGILTWLTPLAAACFVFGRRFAARGERGWAVYSAVSGLVFAIAFVLSSAGFGQAEGLVDLAGLFQRVAVTVGFGWLTLLAVRMLNLSSNR